MMMVVVVVVVVGAWLADLSVHVIILYSLALRGDCDQELKQYQNILSRLDAFIKNRGKFPCNSKHLCHWG
jgi:hypothetical protein